MANNLTKITVGESQLVAVQSAPLEALPASTLPDKVIPALGRLRERLPAAQPFRKTPCQTTAGNFGSLVFAASGADFALYSPRGMPAWSSSVDDAHYDDPADRTRRSIGTCAWQKAEAFIGELKNLSRPYFKFSRPGSAKIRRKRKKA